MCVVSAESSWGLHQSSYNGCLVSAKNNWEVVQSIYDGYLFFFSVTRYARY